MERLRRRWIPPVLVAVVTIVAFLPTLQNGFVAWDDDRNFLDNLSYRGLALANLRWMWTTFHMGHYVPLSWMTLGLDYALWGMDARGYHLTNLLLHAGNAVLVYFVALRLFAVAERDRARPSGARRPTALMVSAVIAALVFAVHPLRVESVAWATERRDVLSGFFYSATILAYLRYTDRPGRRRGSYAAALALLACALLSKATSMSLPAVLVVLNVYPLRRLTEWRSPRAKAVALELVPFAVLAAAVIPLTLVALAPPNQLTVGDKLAVSAYSLGFYAWKTLLPFGLSPLYAMPVHVDAWSVRFVSMYAVAVALAVGAWWARRRAPAVTAALAIFFVISLPMLGIVQNGPQLAADRYTYHAAPALAILIGAASLLVLDHAARSARSRLGVLALTASAVILSLAALTWRQTGVWHDSATLWTYVLAHDDSSAIAETALGTLRLHDQRYDDAIAHYARAVVLDPTYAEGHDNFGIALSHVGRYDEAAEQFRQAVALAPRNHESHNNLGVELAREGKLDEAIEQYRLALTSDPDYADAEINWANALVRRGDVDGALPHYARAARLRPERADTHLNWGAALARAGRYEEAIPHLRAALTLDPTLDDAREYLRRTLALAASSAGGG